MRGTMRHGYRVYTPDEFFAEADLLTTEEPAAGDGRDRDARKAIGRGQTRGARRAAGMAMLIGAAGAVVVVLAIDALPHTGNFRRRGASRRVAREAAFGTSAHARPPTSTARLPRALARQSRRGGRSPRLAREHAVSAGLRSRANRPPRGEVATSRPAAVPAGRDELARAEAVASSEVPTASRREEFGFER